MMDSTPWTPLSKPLSRCRVALVTTGGVHLKQQRPFDIDNDGYDWSYREIPSTTPTEDLMVTHNHYDHTHVDKDVNFMLPLGRFRSLAGAGVIGELGPRCFSFYGYIRDLPALMATSAKEVASLLRDDGVDAVFLTPAWLGCNRSVGLVQRAIEDAGISTVSVTLFRQLAVKLKLPRVIALRFPFGFPLGREESQQRQIIQDGLDALVSISQPGTIIDLPYCWEE